VILSNSPPQLVACDNNSGLGGTNSSVCVPVQAGKIYLVGVDGVNGAWGRVLLNYRLEAGAQAFGTPKLTNLGRATNGGFKLRVTGTTNKVAVLTSSNMTSWATLITNTAVPCGFEFTDSRATNFVRRYYKLQVLP
jgi:hypothetical protein